MKIYIAASFAYEDRDKTSQRKYLIEKTVERLKKVIHGNNDYYLPHQLTIPNAWDISLEEWANQVYVKDVYALRNSDLVIFLSFGKENNAGSAWEIGFMCGRNELTPDIYKKVKIICISMTEDPESLMIRNSVDAMIKENEIETYNWEYMPNYKVKADKLS